MVSWLRTTLCLSILDLLNFRPPVVRVNRNLAIYENLLLQLLREFMGLSASLILEGGGVPTADAENSASSRVSREP